MRITSKFVVAAAVASVLGASAANAATPPALKCESGQLKTVASFASCLLKAEAKGVTNMASPDFTKCRDKYNGKFPTYETNAGLGVCPSEGDVAEVRDHTEEYESEIALILAGGTLPTCGDGNLDAGEACDSANLNGQTCAGQGFDTGTLACSSECHFDTSNCNCAVPTIECGDGGIDAGEDCDTGNLNGGTCASEGFFNGTLHCGPGCVYDTSDCNPTRYVDTGNTILDYQTGLEWEKKTNSDGVANLANPHDVDNTYTWSVGAGVTTPNGSLYTEFAGDQHFLAAFNGVVTHVASPGISVLPAATCFESHCDWRVPNLEELKSILLNPGCGAAPCVVDASFLPNRSGRYWSDSTRDSSPSGAYFVDFTSPILVASDAKTTAKFARAVRRFQD